MIRKPLAATLAAVVLSLSAAVALPAPAQAEEDYGGDCIFSISLIFANPGQTIPVQGAGFEPFLDLEVLLRDLDGTIVPDLDIDIEVFADGTFSGFIEIPDDVIAGLYTLIIPCTGFGLLGPTATTVIVVTTFIPSFSFVITPWRFPFFDIDFGIGSSSFSSTLQQAPASTPTTAARQASPSVPRVGPGERFGALLTGFQPGSKVSFTRLSDGADVGTALVDSNGVARLITSIPERIRERIQEFRATGIGHDGTPVELISSVELVVPGDAGGGGSDSSDVGPYALTAGILGLGAAALVTVHRRRRALASA